MKTTYILIVAILFSLNSFAADDIKLALCSYTNDSLTISEITSCNELSTNHAFWIVKSFTLSFEANGTPFSFNVIGNTITTQIHQAIQNQNPTKIIVSNIILIGQNNNERKVEGIEIDVIP